MPKKKPSETKPTTQEQKGNAGKQTATAEQEKKAKGHRQRGAGTVVVSKGEVTVGGVVMKEWQRTPLQLVREYCQKQKRPMPQLLNASAPSGRFAIRLILPDPKNKDRDLVFTSKESFPDMILARNCVCLLALHHLQPTLPLHQKLPEPYASMWLKLTGKSDIAKPAKKEDEAPKFVCSICNKSFEKELGLKTHLNKEHGIKKLPAPTDESTPPSTPSASISPVSPVSPVPQTASASAASTPSTPSAPPASSTASGRPAAPKVDHREDKELQNLTLEAKNRFVSKYDQMMAEESRRVARSRIANQKELRKQLQRPPQVLLSDANQEFILGLLEEQHFSLKEFDPEHVLAGDEKESLRKRLCELGFPASAVDASLEVGNSLDACIDWLCVNLPDHKLPKQFRATGNQIRMSVSTQFSIDNAIASAGFEAQNDASKPFEANLIAVVQSIVPSFQPSTETPNMENVEMEISSLQLIFNIEGETPKITVLEKENVQCVRFLHPNGSLLFCLSPQLGYPSQPPLALLCFPALAASVRRAFTKAIYSQYQTRCEGVLYEILTDLDELISKAKESATEDTKHTVIRREKPVHSPSKPVESKPHHPRNRVLDKSILFGSPSDRVSEQRASLPITNYKAKVLDMIQHNQVSIVSGGTGCGKSTQVPQFLMEAFRESDQKDLNIVVCEPRRVSCLGLYLRVIEEQGFVAGNQCPVGYQVQGDVKVNRNTVLTYCTTGVLLRRLQHDSPKGITHIIVDEIHERSVLSDFLLFLLKRIIRSNSDIRIILMSATLNETLFSDYFGGVPSLSVEGRLYKVEERYLDDIIFDTHYTPRDFIKIDSESVRVSADMEAMISEWNEKYQDFYIIPHLLRYIFNSESPWTGGVVLVFLSGVAEIKTVGQLVLEAFANSPLAVEVIACHGSLSTQEQHRVFEESRSGYRVVLSTNIAETSITIPNCRYVIDSGREKRVVFNPLSNLSEMKEVWVSQASAEQRKGRAGRVRSGFVFRLFTRSQFRRMEPFTSPEMLRSPLESLCLQTLRMQLGDPLTVLRGCITPPSADSVRRALQTLEEIQAVVRTPAVALTPLGNHLADLPLDCRLGKMLIFGCLLRCVDAVATIAAFLSQRSVFRAPMEKRDEMMARKRRFVHRFSDHITLLRVFEEWRAAKNKREFCRQNFINFESMQTVALTRKQYFEELANIHFLPSGYALNDPVFNANGSNENVLKAAITAGLYANVVKIEKKVKFHRTIEGGAFESTPLAKEYRMYIRREVPGGEVQHGLTRVFVHPSSINFVEQEYKCPYLVYTTVVNTSKIFINDSTVVTPYAILLFGGPIDVQHLQGTISVDKWIEFSAPARVAVLIKGLRGYMDRLLLEKFNQPEESIVNDPVMEGICKLLTTNGIWRVSNKKAIVHNNYHY